MNHDLLALYMLKLKPEETLGAEHRPVNRIRKKFLTLECAEIKYAPDIFMLASFKSFTKNSKT